MLSCTSSLVRERYVSGKFYGESLRLQFQEDNI